MATENASATFLITGGTGIMGSWVLAEGLRRGHRAVALTRARTSEEGRERLDLALEVTGYRAKPEQLEVFPSDNTASGLGLSSTEWASLLGRLDRVIHCAALTSFSKRKDELIWSTNVGGVDSMLSALAGTGVPLHHVSTAYVSNASSEGIALEGAPKPEAACRNQYERSKRAAELRVLQAMEDGAVEASIYRPSIIAGATGSGRIHQFLNVYQLLRLVDLVESGAFPLRERLRVQAHPEATLNVVPCDWVARALWDIIESPHTLGRTYHLTSPAPLSLGYLADWARQRLAQTGATIEFLPSLDNMELTEMEQYIQTMSQIFLEYISRPEPRFSRANTDAALGDCAPFPTIDGHYLDTLLSYAKAQEWQSAYGKTLADLRGS